MASIVRALWRLALALPLPAPLSLFLSRIPMHALWPPEAEAMQRLREAGEEGPISGQALPWPDEMVGWGHRRPCVDGLMRVNAILHPVCA